jgi:hypothetical protein
MKRIAALALFLVGLSAPAHAQNCLAAAAQTFCVPDVATAGLPDARMSRLNELDVLIQRDGAAGVGVVSGAIVTAQGTPDMTVAVSSGTVRIAAADVVVSSGNLTIGAADATNPRWDVVSVNAAGTKAVVGGTAASSPKPPAPASSTVVLAFVWVPAAASTIVTADIVPKRMLVSTHVALADLATTATSATTAGSATTASTASALAADPADCSAGQYAVGVTAVGAATCSAVTDAQLSTSDVVTNDVSITKHGFAPKAPNDATKYLDGSGAYSVPASGNMAFPATVTGGVSGGIPCFTATTTMSASAALLANALLQGGGAGVCPTSTFFAVTGPATTLKTFTFPDASATVFTSNGLTAGRVPYYNGTTLVDDPDMGFVTDNFFGTKNCSVGVLGAANTVCLNSNAIISEGPSADSNKLTWGFGNHTGILAPTMTAGAGGLLDWANSGAAFQVNVRSDSAAGYAGFGSQNDQGANSSANFLAYGSANGATLMGISVNNATVIYSNGSASTGMMILSVTARPVVFGAFNIGRYYIEDSAKALTDATATTIFVATLGNDTDSGGTVSFCVTSGDLTTTRQKTCGEFDWSAVDVTAGAGGETCTVTLHGTPNTASSSGTLAVTADTTTGTDLCNVRVTADSSLDTASAIRYSVQMHPGASAQVITPQ